MSIRMRKHPNKKMQDKKTTPETKRCAQKIRDRILEDDAKLLSALEDCEPPTSQEAYELCESVVETPVLIGRKG